MDQTIVIALRSAGLALQLVALFSNSEKKAMLLNGALMLWVISTF